MNSWLPQTLEQIVASCTDQGLFACLNAKSEFIRKSNAKERADLMNQIVVVADDRPNACRYLLSELADSSASLAEKRENLSTSLIEDVYVKLASHHLARLQLLLILIRQGRPEDLAMFAYLITESPPEKPEYVLPAFAVLMQMKDWKLPWLFPKLLLGLQNNVLAGLILDFTNFLVRSGRVTIHPATDSAKSLTDLLGLLVGQLGAHEDSIRTNPKPDLDDSRGVSESIALVISICDALSLMRKAEATGKIFQVMELSHRRLRVEAAAALVRLNEQSAIQTLTELASEPLVRLRVLAYSEELGVLDQVDEKYSTRQARAEAELTLLLAEPTHFGFPPKKMILVDTRFQYWPGFDEPVECFLFRYQFDLEHGELTNVGIVGPVTQALSGILNHLSIDDLYAAYAGWHAEHDDIFTIQIDHQNSNQAVEVGKYVRRMRDAGFEQITPLFIGSFFGERILVANGTRHIENGTIVASSNGEDWFPRPDEFHHLPALTCYDIVKGRKLLRSFNEASRS